MIRPWKAYGGTAELVSVMCLWCLQVGNIGQVNYAASKAGVEGLTRTAAKELSRWEEPDVPGPHHDTQPLQWTGIKAKGIIAQSWLFLSSRFGIRCNCVLPGFITTPMTDKVPEKVISKVGQGSETLVWGQKCCLHSRCRPGVTFWPLRDRYLIYLSPASNLGAPPGGAKDKSVRSVVAKILIPHFLNHLLKTILYSKISKENPKGPRKRFWTIAVQVQVQKVNI